MRKSLAADDKTKWLRAARLGAFVHFGPYAQYARGEQVLVREYLDQDEYADRAMRWRAPRFDARRWVAAFKAGGARYAVLTTRHMDGFCLWDTKTTNYNSVRSAAGRDFVREFVDACREAELKVGLYFCLADFRVPAYFAGPRQDRQGFDELVAYNHAQVEELITRYGTIDLLWFDAAWPHSAEDWQSESLIAKIRTTQPRLIVNDRLGAWRRDMSPKGDPWRNYSDHLSDFNTCEQRMIPFQRPWEMCDTSTWTLWGYTAGEHWKTPAEVLDLLAKVVSRGGTLLLNVGPKPDGTLPAEYVRLMREVGVWLTVNGEAVYGAGNGGRPNDGVVEFITHGYQTVRGRSLYCILRFWDGEPVLTLRGIATPVRSARLLGFGKTLRVEQNRDQILVNGLPKRKPGMYFPVLRLDFNSPPRTSGIFGERLWQGDMSRMLPWVLARRSGDRPTEYVAAESRGATAIGGPARPGRGERTRSNRQKREGTTIVCGKKAAMS